MLSSKVMVERAREGLKAYATADGGGGNIGLQDIIVSFTSYT